MKGLKMQKTLLIWDFDGVLADSERLWLQIWYDMLVQKRGLKLSEDEVQKYLVGLSAKTKCAYLNTYFNAEIDEDFISDVHTEEIRQIKTIMQPISGAKDIVADNAYAHCVATGGISKLTKLKLEKVGLWQTYIDEHNCFTSDMVQNGKPAPDLFLFAAKKMGYKPENCLVIEDSINGIKAALAAKMRVVAFIGAQNNNNESYAKLCKDTGAIAAFNSMPKLHQFLKDNLRRAFR